MKLKLALAIAAILAIPVAAHAQPPHPPARPGNLAGTYAYQDALAARQRWCTLRSLRWQAAGVTDEQINQAFAAFVTLNYRARSAGTQMVPGVCP